MTTTKVYTFKKALSSTRNNPDVMEYLNSIFTKYLKEYSKDKKLKELYYDYILSDLTQENGERNNARDVLEKFLIKQYLDIDYSNENSEDVQNAFKFFKKYQNIIRLVSTLEKKAEKIHKKIDELHVAQYAYLPFYSAMFGEHQKFLENERFKKEALKKKAPEAKRTEAQEAKDDFEMWSKIYQNEKFHGDIYAEIHDKLRKERTLAIKQKIKQPTRKRVTTRRGADTPVEAANRALRLASNFEELLLKLPYWLFGTDIGNMDPRYKKLFFSYMRDVASHFNEYDYKDVNIFTSVWFRIKYPKLQNYLVKNLSFTEKEATKFFKKFNAFHDKITYKIISFTGMDRIKFFSYLPIYSALIKLMELKRLPPLETPPKSNIKIKDNEIIEAAKDPVDFLYFALSKAFNGVFDNDKKFEDLFFRYVKIWLLDPEEFWLAWRTRHAVEHVNEQVFNNHIRDLVSHIRNNYEPWSKKQLKDLDNYVKDIEHKLTFYTRGTYGKVDTTLIESRFYSLVLKLMIYAPFIEAFNPTDVNIQTFLGDL